MNSAALLSVPVFVQKLKLEMKVKTRGSSVGVLLLFIITTITLPSGSRCGVLLSTPDSKPDSKSDSKSTPQGVRSNRQLLDSDSRRTEEFKTPTDLNRIQTRDKEEAGGSRGRPQLHIKSNHKEPRSTKKGPKNQNREEQTLTDPPDPDCTEGTVQHVVHGKFTITGQLEANSPHGGYQADSTGSVQAQDGEGWVRGQRPGGSEESWQRLQPVVECGDGAMTLTVRRRRAAQLLLDRVNTSSVPLSLLSPECGYSVQSSWKDLSLMAQYDACHVTQEDDHYVLPLLWRGTPVKMSCPTSHTEPHIADPPTVCCSPYGLAVRVHRPPDAEELRVNVRGEWTPLEALAEQCGYTVERRDAEIILTAPYITCGVTVKDGWNTLSLQTGEKTFTLSCPVSTPEEIPLPHEPPIDRHLQPREPPPWAPPFYLAPPYYPHPTYHHKPPLPHDNKNPPPAPDPMFVPRALPPVLDHPHHVSHRMSPPSPEREKDSSDVHQKTQEPLPETPAAARSPSSDAGFLSQEEAALLQQPSHAFAQYYHYYHHPKIPLTGPNRDPDPGLEAPTDPPPSPLSSSSVLPSEASSDSLSPPGSPGFTHKASRHPDPDPALLYPHPYFYYFPHAAGGDTKEPPPLPQSPSSVPPSKASSDSLSPPGSPGFSHKASRHPPHPHPDPAPLYPHPYFYFPHAAGGDTKEPPPSPPPSGVPPSEASSDSFSPPGSPGFSPKASRHLHPPHPDPASLYLHPYFYYIPHAAGGDTKEPPPLPPSPSSVPPSEASSDSFSPPGSPGFSHKASRHPPDPHSDPAPFYPHPYFYFPHAAGSDTKEPPPASPPPSSVPPSEASSDSFSPPGSPGFSPKASRHLHPPHPDPAPLYPHPYFYFPHAGGGDTKEPPPSPPSPSSVPPSEASSDSLSPPASPGFSHKASRHPDPDPAPLYPHPYFYYFPHPAGGDTKEPPPLNPETDDQDSKPSGFLLDDSSQENLNLNTEEAKPDEMLTFQNKSAERIQHPLLPKEEEEEEEEEDDDDDDVADDVAANPRSFPPGPDPDPPPEEPTSPPPASNHHLPPYPFYLHPYYYYYYYYYLHLYQLYSRAQSLPDPVSPPPPQPASDPQTSTAPPQLPSNQTTTPPPTKPKHDVPLHPFYHYYHHLHHQPDHQEPPLSESGPRPPSHSDFQDQPLPAAEAGFPSMHQLLQSFYSDHITQQHPCDALEHPDGGEEEREDDVMRGQLKAGPYPPSASPCGLGRVSDIDCSTSPGSCLFSVEELDPSDCMMGQLLMWLPDSALGYTVALPAHPSEVFDQTEFYLMEDGVVYFPQDPSSVHELVHSGPDSKE